MNFENPIFILLAGGKSSRMGMPKGLLPYKNTYWILEQINRFKTNEKGLVYIGLGFDYQLYFNAIPWFKKAIETPKEFKGKLVQVIVNTTPELGSFSNLQSVLKKVKVFQDILVLPVDVPLLKSSALKKITQVNNVVVMPNYNHKNGHPVKISYSFWKTFLTLTPLDVTARLDVQIKQKKASEISIVNVADCSVLKNLNTPERWEIFKNSAP